MQNPTKVALLDTLQLARFILPTVMFSKNKENIVEFKHKPVMLEECLEGLQIKRAGIYIDGTIRRSRA